MVFFIWSFLLSVGLPFELYQAGTVEYPYLMPQVVCQSRAFVSEMTSYASILTITAFSVERWLAICFPLKIQAFSKLSRATKIILAVWMVAMVCASPLAYFFQINRLSYPEDSFYGNETRLNNQSTLFSYSNDTVGKFIPHTEQCYLDRSRPDLQHLFINFSFWLFFVIPMVSMVVLYTNIGITIKRAELRQSQDTESHKHDINKTRSRKMIIRMLGKCFFSAYKCLSLLYDLCVFQLASLLFSSSVGFLFTSNEWPQFTSPKKFISTM